MNFEIRIEQKTVDLQPGSGFDLELKNPMLFFASVPGVQVSSVKLADTPWNNLVLGWPHETMVRSSRTNLPVAEVLLHGDLLVRGYADLKWGKGYDLDISSRLHEFFGAWQSQLLTDLPFGTATWDSGRLQLAEGLPAYCLPTHRNDAFFENGQRPAGFTGLVNDLANNDSPIVPWFFVGDVFRRLTALTGVKIDLTADASFLQNCLMPSNRSVVANMPFEVRNYLSALTAGSFLLGLRNFFGLALFFDTKGKRLRICTQREIWRLPCRRNWSRWTTNLHGQRNNLTGLELSSTNDSNDGLSKDPFYLPYPAVMEGSYFKVESAFSGILKNASGELAMQIPGITATQVGKQLGPRLAVHTAGGEATNQVGGVELTWRGNNGLAVKFWQEEERFRTNGFAVEAFFALPPSEIAWIAAVFRGEVAEAPFVHVHGVNYVVESMVVPSDGTQVKVKMWRLW